MSGSIITVGSAVGGGLSSTEVIRVSGSPVNVAEFGAVGGGVVDDTAAIAAAATATAAAGGTLAFTAGKSYLISSTLALNCHVEGKGAILVTGGALNSGTGPNFVACTAVLVGTSGANLNGKKMYLPDVVDATFSTPGTWSSNRRIGVECRNLVNCDVHFGAITGFSIGAYVTSDAALANGGNQINWYFLNLLLDNKVNLQGESTGQGWVNENNFYGGDFQLSGGVGAVYSGSRHVKLINGGGPGGAGAGCNANMFIKPCLEGDRPEFHIEFVGAQYNEFHSARFETSDPATVPPKINADSTSYNVHRNTIRGGYAAEAIVWTGDASQCQIVGQQQILYDGGGSAGTIIASNESGDTTPTFVVMPVSSPNGWIVDSASGGANDPVTKYKVAIAGDFAKFKAKADTNARVWVDTPNDSIWFGLGGSAATDSRVGLNAGSTISAGALEMYGSGTLGTILGQGTTYVNVGDLSGGNSALFNCVAGSTGVFLSTRLSSTTISEIFTPATYSLEVASSVDLDLYAVGGDINIAPLTSGHSINIAGSGMKAGFYGVTAVAQASRAGQLTDSTAGTPGSTLAAVTGSVYATDIPTIRNWAASLAQRVNALETIVHNLGLSA